MSDITTTSGDTFTYRESCEMAAMVYKRFGYDLSAATAAWNRMMQTTTDESAFSLLLTEYAIAA